VTATLDGVTNKKPEPTAEAEAARELVRLAREQGLSLTGPDGLLKQLTKTVIETALGEEITGHLGYEKNDPAGQGHGGGNVRNGSRPKSVLTDSTGQVEIDVPRDRAGTFEPQIVRKRQRRLNGVDEIVLSLYAKGLTTGEISAHFQEIYGASVSRETVSRITDKVIEEMQAWQQRPLDAIYAAVFIDAIVVKIRDGQVANRPVYAAIGVTLDGGKDILRLWAGTGGESAKFWMAVLTDISAQTMRGANGRASRMRRSAPGGALGSLLRAYLRPAARGPAPTAPVTQARASLDPACALAWPRADPSESSVLPGDPGRPRPQRSGRPVAPAAIAHPNRSP
jgi:putative transposase